MNLRLFNVCSDDISQHKNTQDYVMYIRTQYSCIGILVVIIFMEFINKF